MEEKTEVEDMNDYNVKEDDDAAGKVRSEATAKEEEVQL